MVLMRIKSFAALCLILSLLFALTPTVPAQAAKSSLAAPEKVTVKVDGTRFNVSWQNPASVIAFAQSVYDNYEGWVMFLVDWRVNGGAWHYEHAVTEGVDIFDYHEGQHNFMGQLIYTNGVYISQTTLDKLFVSIPYHVSINDWLKENKLEIRINYVYQYWNQEQYSYVNEFSAYSDIVSLGVQNPGSGNSAPLTDGNSLPNPPSSLGSVQDLSVVIEDEELTLRWKQPEDIKTLSDMEFFNVYAIIDFKINDGDWHDGYRGFSEYPYIGLTRSTLYLDENGYANEYISRNTLGVPFGRKYSAWLSENTVYFRIRFVLRYMDAADDYKAKEMISSYSNTVAIGRNAKSFKPSSTLYENASSWAIPELNRAAQYGFITSSISARMNAPITRQEICEVIIRMYERVKGVVDISDLNVVFSDTTNADILKAYKLGIVNGIGNGKFAPNDLTNREQVAAMMHRAVKALKPDVAESVTRAERFADESLISSWALESVRFMNRNGIIKGNDRGFVDPKGTTTREQAVLIVLRTFEQFGQ